jgi:hypothetical protein
VNDVPGWLVAIAPSGIGVPVAFTPGLVPHCDVLTAPAFAVPPDVVPDEPLLPHPAATSVPITATRAAAARAPRAFCRILT